MRLFSWHGLAALALAAGCGYVAGVGDRHGMPMPAVPRVPSMEEEATPPPPPPGLAFGGATIEGVRLDDIDLTCPPHFTLPLNFITETSEPPVADPTVHRATYEFPSGVDEGHAVPPNMPYLDDSQSELDIPMANASFQFGTPPFSFAARHGSDLSFTEMAMGLGWWPSAPMQLP